jgi:hypothetical protein
MSKWRRGQPSGEVKGECITRTKLKGRITAWKILVEPSFHLHVKHSPQGKKIEKSAKDKNGS